LAAAEHVLPVFAMWPIRILEDEDEIVPRPDVTVVKGRPGLTGVAAIPELTEVARSARWARDEQGDLYCL
jgi:hypothetical protein